MRERCQLVGRGSRVPVWWPIFPPPGAVNELTRLSRNTQCNAHGTRAFRAQPRRPRRSTARRIVRFPCGPNRTVRCPTGGVALLNAPPASSLVSERLRVAVVGAGIGRSHVRGYKQVADRFEVVALCDIDRERATAAAEEYAIPRVVTEFSELCHLDALDVIDICTPPHLHFEQIQQVLAAGKHAICEKPLVSSLCEVDQLARAEAAANRRIMPIFQYRFGH